MWLIYLCKLPSFITKTSIISIYCNFKNYNSDMNTVLIDFFIGILKSLIFFLRLKEKVGLEKTQNSSLLCYCSR